MSVRTSSIDQTLAEVFGYHEFRPHQRDIVEHVQLKFPKGEDARKNASQQEKNKSRTGSSAQEPPKGAVTQAPAQNQQDKGKSTAAPPSQQQQQQKGATTQTPAQQQQKGATTQTPTPQQQQGATQTSSEQQQGTQAPAQQQKSTTQAPAQTQQPATAQSNAPSSTTNTTQQTTTQQNTNQLPPQKQVQISETFSRTKVAPPERNLRSLNISINVGTVVPPRVRFHRLPREVWAIEPRYRDYDYFTTEEDIVIVEPRSHRIVSLVPRNPQRARAQATQVTQGGGSSLGSAQAGPPPCQIMRRDQNGQLTEVRPDDLAKPSTVGSGGQQGPALSIMVEANGGQNMPPIPLDAPGQIVVASQGNGDCQITIEPLQR